MRRIGPDSPTFLEGSGGLTGISKIPSSRWRGRINEYLWGNESFIWNTNRTVKKLHARNLDGGIEPTKHITLHDSNGQPRGIWSNGEAIWVADDDENLLYAYNLDTGARVTESDLTLHAENQAPRGIWSDGTNIWVTDRDDHHVYAYNLDTGARVTELDLTLHPDHQNPTGMHGIGNTIWIADLEKNLVYAYLIPNRPPTFDRPHQEIFSVTMTSQDQDSLGMLTATDPDAHDITLSVTVPEEAPVRIDETSGEIFLSLDEGETLQPGSDTVITLRAADGRRYNHRPVLPGKTDTTEITLRVENTPATGAPSINGIAQVGQVLTASTTEITDPDRLPDVLTYQWIRVDADGISNPTDIGTDSDRYTVSQDDREKTVRVSVTFTDDGGTDEGPLTSDAHPTSGKIPRLTASFGEDAHTVPEGGSRTVTVTLSADPEGTLVIPITTTHQDDASSADYTPLPQDVTFEAGETEKEIIFQATQDSVDDDGESVKLSFGNLPDGIGTGNVSETTVSITDDDFPSITVSFEHATYTVAESDDPSTTQLQENQAPIRVTLSADPERDITILIDRENQGDASDTDYSGVPAGLDFDSGDTERTITFNSIHDTTDDDGESVKLTFGSLPDEITAGTNAEAVVGITDDDDPLVTIRFEQDSHTVAEGDTQEIRFILNPDPERTITFPLILVHQDDASGDDYTVPTTVEFNRGDTEKTITFVATQDTIDDDWESVRLEFGAMPPGASAVNPTLTTVNITDDDVPQLTASFSATTYTAPEGGSVQVKVTLSQAPERQVVIHITKENQGGASSLDYSGVPEHLTFEATDTEMAITFAAADDDTDDDDESVKLTFGAFPPGVEAGTNTHAVVGITDSDVPTVTVNFKDSSYVLTEDNTFPVTVPVDEGSTVTVTVELSADPERSVEIPILREEQGGATSMDYSGVPEHVTFAPGETEKDITFAATEDTVDDDDESVRLSFGNLPDGVNPGAKDSTTISITDNDHPADVSVSFEQDAHTVTEGGSVVVKLTLSQAP